MPAQPKTLSDNQTFIKSYGGVAISGFTHEVGHEQHDASFAAFVKPNSIDLISPHGLFHEITERVAKKTSHGVGPGQYNNGTTLSAIHLTKSGFLNAAWVGDSPIELKIMNPNTGRIIAINVGAKLGDPEAAPARIDPGVKKLNPEFETVNLEDELYKVAQDHGLGDPKGLLFSAEVMCDGVTNQKYAGLIANNYRVIGPTGLRPHARDAYNQTYFEHFSDEALALPAHYMGNRVVLEALDAGGTRGKFDPSADNVTIIATNYMTLADLKKSYADILALVGDGVSTPLDKTIPLVNGQIPRGLELSKFVMDEVGNIIRTIEIAPSNVIVGTSNLSSELRAAKKEATVAANVAVTSGVAPPIKPPTIKVKPKTMSVPFSAPPLIPSSWGEWVPLPTSPAQGTKEPLRSQASNSIAGSEALSALKPDPVSTKSQNDPTAKFWTNKPRAP